MTTQPPHTFEPPLPDTGDERRDAFTPERQIYEPHRVGLPPLGPYLRTLWDRRAFAVALSRTNLRAQHYNTVFGQLWLVINPILLARVYLVLVDILRSGSRGSEFFAHLVGALFAYYFVMTSVRQGSRSVTSGGKLILNTAFPRLLLPLSAVLTAFMRFLPTLGVYVVVHLASGLPLSLTQLWVVPLIALFAVLACGIAMFVAAAQVYFRDISNFLPYVLRVWLYASPILYYAREVPDRYEAILVLNPLAPLLTAWSAVLTEGRAPSVESVAGGTAWGLPLFLPGALFFISREREFAVRL